MNAPLAAQTACNRCRAVSRIQQTAASFLATATRGEAREETFARSAAEQPAGGRLTDLVNYRARIAVVAEWPIDASTLLRLGLYLAIGLGS
jgi:hypothetical protein